MRSFELGMVAFGEHDPEGFVTVSLDLYGEERAGAPAFELHHPYGFSSRPLDPDTDGNGTPTKGCGAIYSYDGSSGHAWLSQDPRVTAKLPRHKPGGSMQYGATGSFAQFDGTTGDYTVYVPYAFDASGAPTKAHLFQIKADPSNASISIVQSSGASVVLDKDGNVLLRSADATAYVQVSNGKILLNAPEIVLNGGCTLGNPLTALPMAPGVAFLGSTVVKVSAV